MKKRLSSIFWGVMGGFIAMSIWAFLLIGYLMIPDLI
jgi:hypothetical protein